jgi:hypothetical protein
MLMSILLLVCLLGIDQCKKKHPQKREGKDTEKTSRPSKGRREGKSRWKNQFDQYQSVSQQQQQQQMRKQRETP